MRKGVRHALLAAGLTLFAPASIAAEAGDFAPFARGSFEDIRKTHAGKPLVVHFWSVTCPACVAELGDWAKLSRNRPNIDIVFVNTDNERERARVNSRLQTAGLLQATNFAFADQFVERLYFEVDRYWSGELPFTALIGAEGKMTTVIGALDDAQIAAWFEREKKSGN